MKNTNLYAIEEHSEGVQISDKVVITPIFMIWRVSMVIQITPKNWSSVPYTTVALSLKFHQNPLIICWDFQISNGQSAWWSGSPPKFNHVPFTTPNPFMKFHHNSVVALWVMLVTDKQKYKPKKTHYRTHNLLVRDNKNTSIILVHCGNTS